MSLIIGYPAHIYSRCHEKRYALPILNIFVPQEGQIPWVACLPFFMVIAFGSFITISCKIAAANESCLLQIVHRDVWLFCTISLDNKKGEHLFQCSPLISLLNLGSLAMITIALDLSFTRLISNYSPEPGLSSARLTFRQGINCRHGELRRLHEASSHTSSKY